MTSASLISLCLFVILQTATSDDCAKFDGAIIDGKILLPTTTLCSCYRPDPTPPLVAAEEQTCGVTLNKKDGIITISLEDLCGTCNSIPASNASSTEPPPGTVLGSSTAPDAAGSIPASNASSTEPPPGTVLGSTMSSDAAGSIPASNASSTEPPPGTVLGSSRAPDAAGSSTTEGSSTRGEGVSSAHRIGEKSASTYSPGEVFLFFLGGAAVGVALAFAVLYVRKRYHARSYETNDAPQQP